MLRIADQLPRKASAFITGVGIGLAGLLIAGLVAAKPYEWRRGNQTFSYDPKRWEWCTRVGCGPGMSVTMESFGPFQVETIYVYGSTPTTTLSQPVSPPASGS